MGAAANQNHAEPVSAFPMRTIILLGIIRRNHGAAVAAEVRAAMPANGLNCHCSECLLDMLNRALGGRAPS